MQSNKWGSVFVFICFEVRHDTQIQIESNEIVYYKYEKEEKDQSSACIAVTACLNTQPTTEYLLESYR